MVKVINDKLAILRFSDENLCNEPIKDNSYCYLRPEEFYILQTFFIRIFDFCR